MSLYSNILSILCGRIMWNVLHDVRHKYGATSKIILFFSWMQRMYKDNEGVLPTIPNWCIIIYTKKNEKIRNIQEIIEFDWLCQNQGKNWQKRDSQSNTSSPPLFISHVMHSCFYRQYHPAVGFHHWHGLLDIQFKPFGCIALWLSNHSGLSVPDEDYFINALCTLNMISTFVLLWNDTDN